MAPSVAPVASARSMELTFPDPTLLRGCPLTLLLRGFGRHLLSAQVAEEEKPKLLRDSRVVERLDVFVSHSWRDSGLSKYLCMLLHCNGPRAAALSVAASTTAFVLMIVGVLPLRPFQYMPWPTLFGTPLFYLGFLFLHHAPQRPGGGQGSHYFLDKLCIDQCDPARKRAGIEGLGAFIAASDRLLVMWSPTYFTRLWCTVELATFLHVQAQSPGGLSRRGLRGCLVFRPLQLPTPTVAAMVVLQLGMLALQTRIFVPREQLLGWLVVRLAFLAAVPFVTALGLVHMARVLARDRADLDARLAQFRIEEADCSQDSDRDIIYTTVRGFFGSLDAFNQLMRSHFREAVLAGLPGRNGVPLDFSLFITLPLVSPSLDWTAYSFLVYRGDWEPVASHTVFVFSSIPSLWLAADLIFRLMSTRRARGLWRPSARPNMMVSLALAVPVAAVLCAQALLSAALRDRGPALIGTYCLLTCGALLIAKCRRPS